MDWDIIYLADPATVGDLRTGIADAEYHLSFEIDHFQPRRGQGQSDCAIPCS